MPAHANFWYFVLDYAINNHLTPFISMQNHYNLVYREEETEMFPTLKVGNIIRRRWFCIYLHVSICAAFRRGFDSLVTTSPRPVDSPIRREVQDQAWRSRSVGHFCFREFKKKEITIDNTTEWSTAIASSIPIKISSTGTCRFCYNTRKLIRSFPGWKKSPRRKARAWPR